jgi:hypothetical protein
VDSFGNIAKFAQKTKVQTPSFSKAMEDDQLLKYKNKTVKTNPHLHSPNHLLADELSIKLNDKKHFAFYLKMAVLYNHDYLRSLAGQIMENKNAKTPGKLFAYLIKKNNTEQKKESQVKK